MHSVRVVFLYGQTRRWSGVVSTLTGGDRPHFGRWEWRGIISLWFHIRSSYKHGGMATENEETKGGTGDRPGHESAFTSRDREMLTGLFN
jgi:hypothetical protein